MLFPQLSPTYLQEEHRDILKRMEAFYAQAITINQSFWQEADTDTRFYAGDQTLYNDLYGNLPASRRRQFNFNRIRRIISLISGHQRKNRKSTIVTPVENGDQETADQFSKIMMWINNQEGVLETVSESFEGALVTGMNLLQVWVDYRSDPVSGNIKVDNCPYNSFLIDPYFKKTDLSDCNHIWKRTFVRKREALSLLPDKEDEIMAMAALTNRDGKFQFTPESYNYGLQDLLTYDEYYYRDYRKQKLLVDSQTGEVFEWRHTNLDERLNLFLHTYPQVTVIEQEVPTVRLSIVVQGRVLYDGPQPLGIDNYPFVPVFAYYSPQMPYFPNRIQGVTRGLRDAQYLYNRRKQIELDILESQINSGWIYKEEALVNPKDVYEQTGQGRGIAIKRNSTLADVQQIIPPQVPPSMLQISETLGKEIMEISGVNEELLGSADDSKAGILSMLRQGAGLTTLQGLFDQLDRAQKLLGRLILDYVQIGFTPGKVKNILEGEEPSPQFYNKAFGRYDVAIEEGLNTTTQKQMQFAQMLQLREVGVPIPDTTLVEACTLQNKTKILETMQQQAQQQQQLQQQQAAIQMEELQARTELAHARADADRGLGLERLSRIEENQSLAVERRAAAVRDENQATLNMVKVIKELDGVDIQHIQQLLSLMSIVKGEEGAIQEQTKQPMKKARKRPQPKLANQVRETL